MRRCGRERKLASYSHTRQQATLKVLHPKKVLIEFVFLLLIVKNLIQTISYNNSLPINL